MSLYTFYLDDSKRDDSDKPKYVVWGGLIIEESVEDVLIDKVFQLKNKYGLHSFDPIKFNPPNKPQYKRQKAIKNQNDFRKQVVSLIASSKVTLIAAYCHEVKKMKSQEMNFQLVNDLSVRFQFFMQKQGLSGKYRGSMVLAYPGEKEALPFSEKYYNIRRGKAVLHSKNLASPGQSSVKLSHLEPSIYFSFERHNPLIQLADYVAGSVAFAIKRNKDIYFSILRPRFRNLKGNIKGIGLIAYPHYTKEIDRLCKI